VASFSVQCGNDCDDVGRTTYAIWKFRENPTSFKDAGISNVVAASTSDIHAGAAPESEEGVPRLIVDIVVVGAILCLVCLVFIAVLLLRKKLRERAIRESQVEFVVDDVTARDTSVSEVPRTVVDRLAEDAFSDKSFASDVPLEMAAVDVVVLDRPNTPKKWEKTCGEP
jgi:hypothetical protein